MNFRIGFGYDVHRLAEGRKLILGGIPIPFTKGLKGHSDADVLIHAICDALLGAAAQGDIGRHFPDTDDSYRDISSLVLLKKTREIIESAGYSIGNIDSTLVLEKPRVADFLREMIKKLASALECDENKISVKATTTEGLGFTGRGEGVAAYAVALLEQKD
jgi:2-C-methyl-D-erythritol 2,4-cyclodiphosphate synthase